MSNELPAFLRARLDEDEAAAKAILEDPDYAGEWHEQSSGVLYVGPGSEQHPLDGLQPLGDSTLTRFIARHDPARVLREVATWRRILLEYSIPPGTDAKYGGTERETGFRLALSFALKSKALEWKDHPDWREWGNDARH